MSLPDVSTRPNRRSILEWWANIVVGHRYSVAMVGVVGAVLIGVAGLGVFDRLNLAGYTVPGSQSSLAGEMADAELGRRAPDIVVLYTATGGRPITDFARDITDRLAAVDPSLLARPVESYWSADPIRRSAFLSSDRTQALAVLTLTGDDGARLKSFEKLRDTLLVPGLDAEFSGYSAVTDAYNSESKHDLILVESITLPIALLLMVFVFGGVVAASVPVLLGGLTILASFGALRLISEFSEVSSFAVNTASLIGLGMAIDYGLFTVSRFREEMVAHGDVDEAVRRTVTTACRTVLFSGLILVAAFMGMLVFPLSAMRSLGFGAMSAVAFAALLSVTVVPAVLAVLGRRIDALALRGSLRFDEARSKRFWAGFGLRVIKRPALLAAGIGLLLICLALPIFGVRFSNIDSSGLPAGNPTRVAQERIAQNFPNATNGVDLVVRGRDGGAPTSAAVSDLLTKANRTSGVRIAIAADRTDAFTVVHVVLVDPDFTTPALETVRALRSIETLDGATVLAGGENAVSTDSYDAIIAGFPRMAAVMTVAILVMMFAAFRSVVLPIKAVVMSALSLVASLGVLTWIFQEGHMAGPLGISPGPLPLAGVVVVVATVFGLSTDYEIFVISRMVEARAAGADTRGAVLAGVAGTGRIVTAAAAILVVVAGAAALSGLSLVKVVGLGMVISVVIDATLIRMALVPSLVVLMGEVNWWSPWRLPGAPSGAGAVPGNQTTTGIQVDETRI
ncbi:MMPL family transporter [Nocardia sp. NPDC050710]|uniref:MMPL family transporter n=1 Tax=Nocardia sp. NPDC050710 TaxID=3157220 RepID=UPI00340C2052